MRPNEIRQKLIDYHLFLVFVWAIGKNKSPDPEGSRRILDGVEEFLRTASSRDIRERGKPLEEILKRLIEAHDRVLPRRKSVRIISGSF